MNTDVLNSIAAASLLASAPCVSAHDGNNSSVSLFHYFSNPDHVFIFAGLAVAALAVVLHFKPVLIKVIARQQGTPKD
ncbi:MAG: hypothetical protein ACJAYC_003913 [Halieaceae bacterium]|jgi:hypothetical protein